ncbi:MAG: TonB-dependent receptor [Sphingosinicella sp.]|nr:TonB-dependent receptor [Sphingosinicella sp.]
MPLLRYTLLAGAALLVPSHALAQSTGATPPPGEARVPASQSDYHQTDGSEIVITGFRRNREDILSGTSVVTSSELTRELRPTIGETLARQPGVSATSFGPNASRPVLRGFQGERVRVLTDGIGSLDASSTSVDHAVAINPLTADRIEILRGPAALLFGSAAIGGVVNVIDARIPRDVPDEAAHVEGIATYGSAADERSINTAVDIPLSSKFVLHFDGNYSKTDDLEIGGFVLSRDLREEAAASADPEIRALADLKGKLPNTAARTWDVAGGAAYVDGDTNVGFSVNRYDSLYGIPVRYSLEPGGETEAPRIDIKQTRADYRAEVDAGSGFIDTVRVRGGYSDYKHNELEESGEIGTTFLNKGFENRLEFVQSVRNGWGGGFGAQYFHRKFDVIGEEKFLPKNATQQIGLFALQTFDLGPFKAEAGARYEHQTVRAGADADLGNPRLKRSFDAYSGSVGGSYELSDAMRVGLNLSHSQRAPSAEELFANGPHAGTQAFEIGDPDLAKEKSWGLEGTLRGEGEGYSFGASIYHSWFKDYIFQALTGDIEDDLPVFQILQDDADYWGFEMEGSVRIAKVGDYAINLDAVADYTRATIHSEGPAPRIPPFRMLGGLEAQSDRVQGRLEAEWVDGQDRLASFETPTDSFTLVNASIAYQPFKDNKHSSLSLSVNNIFDVDARRHASVLKDFAPLAGRDIRLTARFSL